MITWYFEGKRLEKEAVEKNIRNKELVLFGADINRNKQLFEEIDKKNIKYIFDNDEKKWGTVQETIPIVKPFDNKKNTVLISGIHDWKAISNQAKNMGYQHVFFFLTAEIEMIAGKYVSEFSPSVYDNTIIHHKKFKYIHFIPDEKFFTSIIEYIEYGLNVAEHYFVVYGMNGGNCNDIYGVWNKYKELSENYHNIYLYYEDSICLNLFDWEDNKDNLDRLIEKAEKLIFHGEFFTEGIYNYFYDRIHLVKKKGVYIPWSGKIGRDIYITHNIEDILQYVRLIPYAYSIDKETFIKYFPMAQNAIWLRNKVSYARLTEFVEQKKEKTKNVLIAHSPHEYTKATETLQYLSGANLSIQIYCIASYGPQEIIKKVSDCGKKYFESEFHLVDQYMSYKEYVKFLSEMDLAVFGMEFLSGRDTLELLFWLGKKVYLKPGSEACRRMEAAGYKVNNYYTAKEDIINRRFDNLEEGENHAIAENEFNPERKLEQWKSLYEYRFDD